MKINDHINHWIEGAEHDLDTAESERPLRIQYESEIVGDYVCDIVVEDKVILELKAVKEINEIHEVQLVNYLKGTEIEVGLLINFGSSVQVKRKVFDFKS